MFLIIGAGYQEIYVIVDKCIVGKFSRNYAFQALSVATGGFFTFGITLVDKMVPSKYQAFWETVLLKLWHIPNRELKMRKGGRTYLKDNFDGRQAVKTLWAKACQ
jgi:hypothetical protein